MRRLEPRNLLFLEIVRIMLGMAITKGGKKAHRQALRKREMNITRKEAIRATNKVARTAPKGDTAALAAAYKAIDKALKRGILKKNTAARRKAKVAKLLRPVAGAPVEAKQTPAKAASKKVAK